MIRLTTKLGALALLLTIPTLGDQLAAQSIFARSSKRGGHRPNIDDLIANKVGDTLTVVIRESHKIKNEDRVNRVSNSTLASSIEAFDIKPNAFRNSILPDFDIRTNRQQVGNARQEKDSVFESAIAVTIVDELPNGNFVISGRRTVVVDDETKTLKISGVIRKWDIDALNQVQSNRVAEAKVAIEGVGKNTEHMRKGPVGALIETAWWLIWPF